MESLERLRRYVNEHTNKDWEYATFPPQRQLVNCTDTAVFGLIDAIEQEHAKLLDKALGEQDDAIRHAREVAYSTGYEAGFDEGLASTDGWSADDWTGQHEDAMAERGWVKLPVDADGEVVRIGDVMVMASHPFGCEDKPLVVDRMELSRGMHGEVWCLALDTDRSCWTQAAVLRHYQPPTVEDVLREFADRVCNSGHQWGLDAADTIAEYAKKLRLAGDGK